MSTQTRIAALEKAAIHRDISWRLVALNCLRRLWLVYGGGEIEPSIDDVPETKAKYIEVTGQVFVTVFGKLSPEIEAILDSMLL